MPIQAGWLARKLEKVNLKVGVLGWKKWRRKWAVTTRC